MATTPRWGLRYPTGGDAPDVPTWMHNLALDLDGVAMDDQGPLSARPTSTTTTPGRKGRYWLTSGDTDATQNGRLWRDNGNGWDEVPIGVGQRAEVGDFKYALQSASHGARPDGLFAWLLLDGSELTASYTDLITLLTGAGKPFGTGPNGRPRLPNLIGRVPLMAGDTAGLTTRGLGEAGGEETHRLTSTESGLVDHGHGGPGMGSLYHSGVPTGIAAGFTGSDARNVGWDGGVAGSGARDAQGAHNNMQPYLAGGYWHVKS